MTSPPVSFDYEGQCVHCGLYAQDTNIHNQCRECAQVESTWPPLVPEHVQAWPSPLRTKTKLARWYGTAAQYRAFFGQALTEQGEDALAVVYNDSPHTLSSHPTRWFCPGLPMLYTGQKATLNGRPV